MERLGSSQLAGFQTARIVAVRALIEELNRSAELAA